MKTRETILEEKLAFTFKLILLFYLFFQSLIVFHRTAFVSIALWLMLLLGAMVCVLRAIRIKKFICTKGIILLGLFLFSYAIAIVCNIKYGLGADMANLVILFLTIAIGYVTNSDYEKNSKLKEIKIISHVFIVLIDLSIIASIVMLFIGYGDTLHYDGYQKNIGFVENRLWGVFGDPNVAAVFSVVCLLLCIYFLKTTKHKMFYIFTLILVFMYLAFSDSRTGTVCMIISGSFVSYAALSKLLYKKYKNVILGRTLSIIVAVVISFSVSMVPKQIQKGYNGIVEFVNRNNTEEDALDLTIKREYDLSQDVTNKRAEIWRSGIEIFVDKPITGIGFHHLKDYVKQELPNTYLAQKDVNFSHFHNEILNVLVSQGLLGFIPIFLFAVTSIVDVFKKYLTLKDKEYFGFAIGISCLLTICVGIMLNQGILYSYMPINLLFWMYLSYMRNNQLD